MYKNYEFANIVFKIDTIYSYFHDFAKAYVSDKKEIETITILKSDIDIWIKEHNVDTSLYSYEYIETLVVHSKLADILSSYNAYIFHGSSIYVDNKDNAYIFTATSGTGKSTHINLLVKNYWNRIKYINDDKPFLSIEDNAIYVYGSPFDGKERKSNNVKCKLKGIFIISRDKNNSVKQIKSIDALEKISNQLHIPNGIDERKSAFNFLFKMMNLVPFYDLKVNMLDEAAKISFKIMIGK